MNKEMRVLESIDNFKLMDIVKNYKQYGYDSVIKKQSIQILKERGYTDDDLILSGILENREYNEAEKIYKKYIVNSKYAIFLYFANLILLPLRYYFDNTFMFFLYFISISLYILYIFRAYSNINNFYDYVHKENRKNNFIFFSGVPLYILVYYIYKEEMQVHLKSIK